LGASRLRALLGFGSALIAVVFIRSIFLVDDLFKSWAPRVKLPRWAWPGVGGLGVGLLALGFPEVLGVGYELTDMALQGVLPFGLLAALLVAKLLATALSLGSGFSGGVFSPSLARGRSPAARSDWSWRRCCRNWLPAPAPTPPWACGRWPAPFSAHPSPPS
jgi:H+/Cl- antiporter ClcA